MDDILTRWASDLSKYQKEFKEQASKVADWDRLLVESGERIQRLYLNTYEAERASNEIEKQLMAVESQQDELENWLDRYEADVQEMVSRQYGPGDQLGGPDQERERTYKLAEKLSQHLDEKNRDLSKMVKEINDISDTLSKSNKGEDPVSPPWIFWKPAKELD
jgi:nuclear pore complex protein Nup62